MVTTKEEVKKKIFSELKSLATKSASIEEFSRSRLEKSIKAHTELMDTALTELEQEDAIDSRTIQMQVYLPNNRYGKDILKEIARSGYLKYSSLSAALFALGILYLAVRYYPWPLEPPKDTQSFIDAYKAGVLQGVFFSVIGGLGGGYMIREGLSSFRKWQIISEESYAVIATVGKYTIGLSIVFLAAYYGLTAYVTHETKLDQTIVLGLIALAFAVASGIKTLLPRAKKKRSSSEV